MVQVESKSDTSRSQQNSLFHISSAPISKSSLPNPSSEPCLLSDLVIQYLQQLDVDYIFGIPGGAIEPFFDALCRSERRGGPRLVMSRHETGAAFMADGYYHYSGKLGVCCATTGPGTTNLITGVASAFANQIPMLVITAQTALPNFGKGALQESSCTGIDTVAMMKSCTRFNSLVSHANQFETKLVNAIVAALGPTPGPAHISVPFDLWRIPVSNNAPKYLLPNLIIQPNCANKELIAEVVQRAHCSSKIVFVVGDHCSEAIDPIIEICELLDAKIVTTPQAKSLINPNHCLYRGVIGFAGHALALNSVYDESVDCIVVIGALMSEFAISGVDMGIVGKKHLIHIDQNHQNFSLSPMADLHVYGFIKQTMFEILDQLKDLSLNKQGMNISYKAVPHKAVKTPSNRLLTAEDLDEYNSNDSPIHPARLMRELPALLPPNTRYIADCGSSFAWAIHYLQPPDRRVRGARKRSDVLFNTCVDYSSMGWAIGCAIGASLALPSQAVACITGDGSILMSGQELTVAIQERLPIIFIILNDSAYGMVKHGQRLTGAERFAYQLPDVDFVAYANSMGASALLIESPDDLEQLKNIDFSSASAPLLLDVRIDKEAVPPIKQRTKVLQKKLAEQATPA